MPPPGFRRLSEDKTARVRGEWENPFDAPYYRALGATKAYRDLEVHVVPRVKYAMLGALVSGGVGHLSLALLGEPGGALAWHAWLWLALPAVLGVAVLWLQHVILQRTRRAQAIMQEAEREFTYVPDDYLDAQPGKMLGTREERAARVREEIARAQNGAREAKDKTA